METCLIKCWKNVICKLHFGYGRGSCNGCSYPEPGNALLAQWGVEHAVFAVLVLKTDSASEIKFRIEIFLIFHSFDLISFLWSWL